MRALLTAVFVLIPWTLFAEQTVYTLPISQMPITTNVSETAWFPLIQPYPGRATNDNFRAKASTLFWGRSNVMATNAYFTSIYLGGTNITNFFGGTGAAVNDDPYMPFSSGGAFTNSYLAVTNGGTRFDQGFWRGAIDSITNSFYPTNGEFVVQMHNVASGDPSHLGNVHGIWADASDPAAGYAFSQLYGDVSFGTDAPYMNYVMQSGYGDWVDDYTWGGIQFSVSTNRWYISIADFVTSRVMIDPLVGYTFDTSYDMGTNSIFSVKHVGSKRFGVAADSGWTGTGTNYFGDDGKVHALPAAATYNTANWIPYSTGSSWGDGPWYRISSSRLGYGNTTQFFYAGGVGNLGIGTLAMSSTPSGNFNTAVGSTALNAVTSGFYNVAVGAGSLQNNTNGYHNVAVGGSALSQNRSGLFNTAVGGGSLYANLSGQYNSAFGYDSLASNTGEKNTAHGYDALYATTTGNNNTAVGWAAGSSNVLGSNNVYVGSVADSWQTNLDNVIVIGAGASVTNSNEIVIGNTTNTVMRTPTIALWGTTNQITFGSTNSAPVDAVNVAAWVSVMVTGDTNAYRLPLYK